MLTPSNPDQRRFPRGQKSGAAALRTETIMFGSATNKAPRPRPRLTLVAHWTEKDWGVIYAVQAQLRRLQAAGGR